MLLTTELGKCEYCISARRFCFLDMSNVLWCVSWQCTLLLLIFPFRRSQMVTKSEHDKGMAFVSVIGNSPLNHVHGCCWKLAIISYKTLAEIFFFLPVPRNKTWYLPSAALTRSTAIFVYLKSVPVRMIKGLLWTGYMGLNIKG